ncbi:MAG: deoxyribodipyrimidine photo-lyase [Verrucomicrobiales bacterium]|nr:deoxyribodipyrimidine photo-lyase [Verrucomicrobiales bacterium]
MLFCRPAMGNESRPVLVWLRADLRLADQPAFQWAIRSGGPVIPVFIWAPEEEAPWQPGAASRWWLHHSLVALESSLRERGSRLILRRGASLDSLRALAKETGARAVVWNRRYEPAVIARDTKIKEALKTDGLEVESFNALLLCEPWTVHKKDGGPFQVFTPYWKACLELLNPGPAAGSPAPAALPSPKTWPKSEPIEALGLLPKIPWDTGMAAAWKPGEAGAWAQVRRFTERPVLSYGEDRNRPDHEGTSRLSPHLHFGEVSPGRIWQRAQEAATQGGVAPAVFRSWQFLAELGWREFAYHLLYHFPDTPERPLRRDFDGFPWRNNPVGLKAWQRGRTGVPLVDAGMRQLWTTGWMHNRVRMVVGSVLVKNLLISWQEGARWFWDTLVDADLASNTLGWQWVGGCGADAAPYFRIFNPVSQGQKFDPNGDYVRRWVPELARVPAEFIHGPDEAPPGVLARSGVTLGTEYPRPLVEHRAARIAALEAFAGRLSAGVRREGP